ncbi:MAG: exodeoxyribonuclease I [Candidatus Saccharibacteria bacterium]|nr:exodeoxyribonuclease I [Candidatus Saccharibacteria bacterium]
MAASFFFYDLETSGTNPRHDRVMQFAGIRTDMQLKPIGEPHDYLIKLTEDTVPDPRAIMVTGITPQKTIAEGMSEPEFLKIFHEQIAIPNTTFVGFNTVRFDDEFMRYMQYRNFYDPYEWQWSDGKSRWDLLDLVRMTRALRPDGIKWPMDSDGKPSNRLELLSSANKLEHANAHDALSDVRATIALARLIRNKQPKLFDFLLQMRNKQKVAELVEGGSPFIYTSGRYDNAWEKTTAVGMVAKHPKQQAALVFDLRHDPDEYKALKPAELADKWRYKSADQDTGEIPERLPVKMLKYNRCPAIAPLAVLDQASQKRLGLSLTAIQKNYQKLQKANLGQNIIAALEILEKEQQATLLQDEQLVDAQLYDGFIPDEDKPKMSVVRASDAEELESLDIVFNDQRLRALLPLYKARHFPQTLSDEERVQWERFKTQKLLGGKEASRLARYFERLSELAKAPHLTPEKQYILEELQLYGQSIMPSESS